MDKGLKCKFYVETDVTGGGHTKDIDALIVVSYRQGGIRVERCIFVEEEQVAGYQ